MPIGLNIKENQFLLFHGVFFFTRRKLALIQHFTKLSAQNYLYSGLREVIFYFCPDCPIYTYLPF